MRALATAISILLCLAGAVARADDDALPRTVMHAVADDAALCAELRGDADIAESSCHRELSRMVRGAGKVEVWHATVPTVHRWALVIRIDRQLWVSPMMEVFSSGCGAGHCIDFEIAPVLHAIHPRGRAAAVLELDIVERHYQNERSPGEAPAPGRSQRSVRLLACGAAGSGERRCVTGSEAGDGCTVKLGDDGTVARTCRSTEHLALDDAPAP